VTRIAYVSSFCTKPHEAISVAQPIDVTVPGERFKVDLGTEAYALIHWCHEVGSDIFGHDFTNFFGFAKCKRKSDDSDYPFEHIKAKIGDGCDQAGPLKGFLQYRTGPASITWDADNGRHRCPQMWVYYGFYNPRIHEGYSLFLPSASCPP
jgi:hypothetical protein